MDPFTLDDLLKMHPHQVVEILNRYREALEEVKAFVCGEAVSKWGIDPQTTKSRIRIANTCDVALLNLPKG
jgi:predicted amidohydrolase